MSTRIPHNKIHWARLGAVLIAFILLSAGLGYFLENRLASLHVPSHRAWLAYLLIFVVSLVVNLSVLPLPIAISIMIAAAAIWNPVLIALVGSLGASLGEFSSYVLGFLSKKVAIHKEIPGYNMMQQWVQRYGLWAIAFLSFQPILPIEIGGFIAGVAKMPVHQFLPALWLGKFPKYLILMYTGAALIRLVPFPH